MADGATTTTPREQIAPGVDLIAGDCLDVLPTLTSNTPEVWAVVAALGTATATTATERSDAT